MYRRVLLPDAQDEAFRAVLAKAISHRGGAKGRAASAQEARELQKLEKNRVVHLFKKRLDDGKTLFCREWSVRVLVFPWCRALWPSVYDAGAPPAPW